MWPFDRPVQDALRLPGETVVAWAIFDAAWYRTTYPGSAATLADRSDAALLGFYLERGQSLGHSPNRYFDEAWHRRTYPGIADAVRQGQFASAFDAYCRTGNRDRSPHWLFDEAWYRRRCPDLTDAVLEEAGLANGYDHFLRHGNREGRVGHALFDPAFYRENLEAGERDAAARVGPFQHYLMGLEQGKADRETSHYFTSAWYTQHYRTVAEAIAHGVWRSALEHYLCNDAPTAFDPSPDFSEDWYLGRDLGLREAIEAGVQRNGYAHFLRHGSVELRPPAPHIDLRWYATREAVRESLLRGEAEDAFSHWLLIGKPVGYPPAPPPDEQIGEGQAAALFRQNATALLPIYGRAPLRFGCAGEPVLSVVMVVRGAPTVTLATLAALRNNFVDDIELILMVLGEGPDAGDIARFVTGAIIQRFDAEIDTGAAYEAGLACAQASAVLCLAGGLEFAPGTIAAALRRLASDERIGAVGGKVLSPHGALYSAGHVVWNDGGTHRYMRGESPLVPEANFARDVHFCASAFLLFRRDLFTELQEAGAPAPLTDALAAELCVRMAEAGCRVVYDPAVMVWRWDDPDPRQDARLRPEGHKAFLAACDAPDGRALVTARMADRARRWVLFIEDTVPLRGIGSGFVRSNDLIRTMTRLGFAVTVFPVNGCRFSLGSVYADMPDEVEVMHDHDLSRLAEFLRLRRAIYGTIWIARTHNLDRVRPILDRVFAGDPQPPVIILDTEAVSAARAAAHAALAGREFALAESMQREFANAGICRTVVAVSEAEATMLRDFGCPDVRVIGHMRPPHPTPRPFHQRAGMLFAGAIHKMDSPNYDSLCWFVDEVLPLVEQSLGWETRLTIAGYTGAGVTLARFNGHPRVTLRGAVADLEPLYGSHRVFVAPTRFAAGAPYKIHEAASFGLPVVATDLLRRQLGWTDGYELLSADASDPQGFAAHIVMLYRNETLWTSLREAALAALARDNNEALYAAAVEATLAPTAGSVSLIED